MEYPIFHISNYECLWTQESAVVCAESEADAMSLLEEYLRNDPSVNQSMRNAPDLGLKIRSYGWIRETGVRGNKRQVLYPFPNKDISMKVELP